VVGARHDCAAAPQVVIAGHLLGEPGEPLRRLRMSAATAAQLRAWFQAAVDSLDGTYECHFPWDDAATPVPGTARDETFRDWVITGFHRRCFPRDIQNAISEAAPV
jgi:hypothetical protein